MLKDGRVARRTEVFDRKVCDDCPRMCHILWSLCSLGGSMCDSLVECFSDGVELVQSFWAYSYPSNIKNALFLESDPPSDADDLQLRSMRAPQSLWVFPHEPWAFAGYLGRSKKEAFWKQPAIPWLLQRAEKGEAGLGSICARATFIKHPPLKRSTRQVFRTVMFMLLDKYAIQSHTKKTFNNMRLFVSMPSRYFRKILVGGWKRFPSPPGKKGSWNPTVVGSQGRLVKDGTVQDLA